MPSLSVVTVPLKADNELPAMPVNLRSGFTQRLISLPSKNTEILVFGFSLLITNLTGWLLAKNCNDVDTELPLTIEDCTPLATSLFCGLMFEELEIEALLTEDWDSKELICPRELIDVNDGEDPTQLTTKELYKLEKLSLTSCLAIKILYRSVFVSTTRGSTDWSYHWSILGDTVASPTYCKTTNGFGFSVFEAKLLPNKFKLV